MELLRIKTQLPIRNPLFWGPGPVVPLCLSCLHTIRIRLTLLSAVEVGQQVAGAPFQVRAEEVAVKVGQELVQTVVVRRAPEVLGVLVQPRAQDGRNGTEWHRKDHMLG